MPLTLYQTAGKWHGSVLGRESVEFMSKLISSLLERCGSGHREPAWYFSDWQAVCYKTVY